MPWSLDSVPANMPDRHPPVFRHFSDDLGELLAAFGAKLRKHNSNEFFIHGRVQPQIALLDGLLNRVNRAGVPRLDQYDPSLGNGDSGQFADPHV